MRSGLLTAGIILLALGALFYFIPPMVEASTVTNSATTDKYAHLDDTDQLNSTNQTITSTNRANNTTNNSMNSIILARNTTNSSSTTTSDNSFWTIRNGSSNTSTVTDITVRNNVGDPAFTPVDDDGDGIATIYITMDAAGNIFPADKDETQIADTRSTASVRTAPVPVRTTTVTDDLIEDDVSINDETTAVMDTSTNSVNNANNSNLSAGIVTNPRINEDNTNSVTTSAAGSNWLRNIALLSMILGALLTLAGLLLPSRDDTPSRTVRTAGAPARRVEYERETTTETEKRK